MWDLMPESQMKKTLMTVHLEDPGHVPRGTGGVWGLPGDGCP